MTNNQNLTPEERKQAVKRSAQGTMTDEQFELWYAEMLASEREAYIREFGCTPEEDGAKRQEALTWLEVGGFGGGKVQ